MMQSFKCPWCEKEFEIDNKDGFGWMDIKKCPLCSKEIDWEYEDDDFCHGFLFPIKPWGKIEK